MGSAESRVADRKSNNNPTPAPPPPTDPSLRLYTPANGEADNHLQKLDRDMTTTSEKPPRRRRSPAPATTEALLKSTLTRRTGALTERRARMTRFRRAEEEESDEDHFSLKPERDRQERENVRKDNGILLNLSRGHF